jgi:hypothetical protein
MIKKILKSKQLNSNEKILIMYIIGVQEENKECTYPNNYVANQIGISTSQLNYIITSLNKTTFFNSSKRTTQNQYGAWINDKIMVIDNNKLELFLDEEFKYENFIKELENNPGF